MNGNINERRNVGGSSGKSSLFFLTVLLEWKSVGRACMGSPSGGSFITGAYVPDE